MGGAEQVKVLNVETDRGAGRPLFIAVLVLTCSGVRLRHAACADGVPNDLTQRVGVDRIVSNVTLELNGD